MECGLWHVSVGGGFGLKRGVGVGKRRKKSLDIRVSGMVF